MSTTKKTSRLTVKRLISIAANLGHQQAALDHDAAGVRDVANMDASTELASWFDGARNANDDALVKAMNRYHSLANSTRTKIGLAYLNAYASAAA